MKIQLILVGKTNKDFLKEGMNDYENRIKRYNSFEIITIPDIKKSNKLDKDTLKNLESEQILKKIPSEAFTILLDERGKSFTSRKFAHFLHEKFVNFSDRIIFVIGGAYGFSEDIYRRANIKISLSDMTFSHQLIRIVFLEQLYRAFTIIKGDPYHND